MTFGDEDLALAFAGRAPEALDAAYRRHADFLRAVARRALESAGADAADAADCVHDVLMRVWAGDGYRAERGSLRAYLAVSVRNEALGRARDARRHAAIERRAAHVVPPADARPDERDPVEAARVRAALAALPAEQRRVIELAYFGGRSQREIASELGAPLGTIKSRAALGLRKLAAAFDAGKVRNR